jgi:hypothetical protein
VIEQVKEPKVVRPHLTHLVGLPAGIGEEPRRIDHARRVIPEAIPRLASCPTGVLWTEELLRDEKSSGSHWGESHVHDPAHAARPTLLIALTTYLALEVGARVIQAGLPLPGVGLAADTERLHHREQVGDVLSDP